RRFPHQVPPGVFRRYVFQARQEGDEPFEQTVCGEDDSQRENSRGRQYKYRQPAKYCQKTSYCIHYFDINFHPCPSLLFVPITRLAKALVEAGANTRTLGVDCWYGILSKFVRRQPVLCPPLHSYLPV